MQVLALREALGRLSPTDRELIWRCDGEGYSVKALARAWGVREDVCVSGCTMPVSGCARFGVESGW